MPYSRPVAEEIVSAITATSGGPKGRGARSWSAAARSPCSARRSAAGRQQARRRPSWPRSGAVPRTLQRALQRGLRRPAPLLEPEDRQAELTGEELHGLAAQQPEDHLALAPRAPSLA